MNVVLSEKKQELLGGLLDSGMVLIAVNGRHDGVDLPASLRDDPQVRLNLSFRFGLHMDLDDWGVHATLTFGGMPYDCKIPWDAIFLAYAHESEEQYLFPADLPMALLDELQGDEGPPGAGAQPAEAGQAAEASPPRAEKKRPVFSVVQGGVTEPPEAEERDEGGEDESPPTHLRRIK